MFASDGEILTLRPEGFAVPRDAIDAYLQRLPGSYRRSPEAPWTLVVPASELPRLIAAPMARVSQLGEPHYATLRFIEDGVWIHPGLTPDTWARAQQIVGWLLGLGPWRITGELEGHTRELGIVRNPDELFKVRLDDPGDPTESPPRTGQLITFRRYLTNPDDDSDYHHEFLRIHDSGAFSYLQCTAHDERVFTGRLAPAVLAQVRTLTAQLDVTESSPGYEDEFADRVAVIVERPGARSEKVLDAEHPPHSFAPLVRLMNDWAAAWSAGQIPDGFLEVRETSSSTPAPERDPASRS